MIADQTLGGVISDIGFNFKSRYSGFSGTEHIAKI